MPRPVAALTDHGPDLASTFARCLGRYSAQIEDAWYAQGADITAQERRHLFTRLFESVRQDATTPPEQLLHLQIEAKFAQARLLTIARFHDDPGRKTAAMAQARLALRPCDALVF
ncbi:hypothetical protein [Sagittula sp. SSi028]|uniref:hypothetical protein n=1 Tax=Sagittula sp. SSi028 TaxID=3400636 RepID=UPI003AF95DE1